MAGPDSTRRAGRGVSPRWSMIFDVTCASPRVPMGAMEPMTTASTSSTLARSMASWAASSAMLPRVLFVRPKGVSPAPAIWTSHIGPGYALGGDKAFEGSKFTPSKAHWPWLYPDPNGMARFNTTL